MGIEISTLEIAKITGATHSQIIQKLNALNATKRRSSFVSKKGKPKACYFIDRATSLLLALQYGESAHMKLKSEWKRTISELNRALKDGRYCMIEWWIEKNLGAFTYNARQD